MSTSQGLGRRRPGLLAFQPWKAQFGLGPLGQDAGKVMANELYFGGYPPRPVEIPMGWLRGPVRLRMDPPFARAEVAQSGAATARGRNSASVVNGREWVFTESIDSLVSVDAANLAKWVTDYYTDPLPRTAAFTLTLNNRTETEIWRILGVTQGTRISITGAPGSPLQLLSNPWFESGSSPWTGQNGSVAQSSLFPRSGNGSLLLTPTGGIAVVNALSEIVSVSAGAPYTTGAWALAPLGWSGGVSTGMNWFSGGAFVSTFFDTPVTLQAGVMTQLPAETFTAPDGIDGGQLRIRMAGTPASTDLLYFDELTVTGPDGTRSVWPDGATELVVEGITHTITGDVRTVTWNTAPIIGAVPGVAGPWFYSDDSRTSSTAVVPF